MQQLNKVPDDETVQQIFKCESLLWNSLFTSTNKISDFPTYKLKRVNSFYGQLSGFLRKVDRIRSKLKKSISLRCEELDDFIGNFKSLMDDTVILVDVPDYLILKIIYTLQIELIDLF